MALASDLMGLGMPPFLAKEIAEGGIGPLTVNLTATASSFANATKINTDQFIFQSNSISGAGMALPTVGGDNGSLLCDTYCIGNTGTSSLLMFSSTSVAVQLLGSNNSAWKLQTAQTMIAYPVSTTQWIGILA